jgi:flagella basal body P-ring formation protein FlgA
MDFFPAQSTRRTHTARSLAVLAVVACLGQSALGQGTIELRSTARLKPAQTLTLSSIADLSGPDALRWADLDLSSLTNKARAATNESDAPAEIDWQTITIDQVRGELERQQGIHWGRLSLRGSACNVGIAHPQTDIKPSAAPVPSIKPAVEGPRLQELAEARIAQLVGMDPQDVRIEFAPQDADLLAMGTGGRLVEIQPMGKSDRMALSVRMFELDRVVASGSIRAKVTVRRDVLVLREPIARGVGLTNDNTTIESRWIGPTEIPADPVETIGKVAKGKLKAGQMLIPQDVEPIIAAKKGDQVNVDCISGSIILRRTMRALETGREGDTIALAGSNGKMTAQARLSGPGRAVLILNPLANPSEQQVGPSVEMITHAAKPTQPSQLAAATAADANINPNTATVGGIQVSRKQHGSTQGRKVANYTKLADRKLDDADR